ncbi:hypothetical protein [Cesiribacter sp. SM1]|uniref:hypothetical protein n=1 Tax=Cesiribacter sp. SM1 TaxID=2861196 RepID=UPI001CD6E422|nr:hypothetical protein [Cesiribacter sp. SM1]
MSSIQKLPKFNVLVPRPEDLNLCPELSPSQQLAVCDFNTTGIGAMLQSSIGEGSIIGYLSECLENIDILAGIDKPKKLSEQMQDMLIMGIMEVVREFRSLTFGQLKRAIFNGMSGKYDVDGKVYGFTAKDVRQWLNAYINELRTEHQGALQKQLDYECSREEEKKLEARKSAHEETKKAILEVFHSDYEQIRINLAGGEASIADIPEEIDRGNILYKMFWRAKLIGCSKAEWEVLVEKMKLQIMAELSGILNVRSKRSKKQGDNFIIDYDQGKAESAARSHIFRQKIAEFLNADMPAEVILQKLEQA